MKTQNLVATGADAGAEGTVGSPPPRDVVVGVDGSRTALSAVSWAAREARTRGAPLRIVHAAPYLGEPGSRSAASPELPRARRIAAVAYTVARHTAPGTAVSTTIDPGGPVPALLRAAAAGQLLVLGISTTGAVDELVLAAVVQKVSARSTQPVVAVPRTHPERTPGRPVVAILGLGDTADDRAVAAFAAAAARRTGRGLAVLQTRAGGAAQADGWAGQFPDLAVAYRSMPGAPGVDLLDAAGPTPLLVLTTGHAGRFHRSLDGLHRWLLRHSTSPMALVPSRQETGAS
ncbi:universal stress protein [Geodermatophilus ruber]|uniref:Nucleotide-binding universal stress protein, UspA family n=1 Tax=Geodermatophilus ruber TaxID=504800 RepID=A0A1I4ISB7_9ACTN|nr:universal stress protein [Geodermatophilus ruber]SFL57175.1 Nucleotide-binding universal stress protein, UspA family [Geodermatophilus ruber]